MIEAKRIGEDAAREAAALIWTLHTERDRILADARDDAQRVLDAAHDSAWIDEMPFTAPEREVPFVDVPPPPAAELGGAHSDSPRGGSVWMINVGETSDDAPSGPQASSGS